MLANTSDDFGSCWDGNVSRLFQDEDVNSIFVNRDPDVLKTSFLTARRSPDNCGTSIEAESKDDQISDLSPFVCMILGDEREPFGAEFQTLRR